MYEGALQVSFDLMQGANLTTTGATLIRYERALDRELYTALKTLHTLQTRRRNAQIQSAVLARYRAQGSTTAPALSAALGVATEDQPPAEDPATLPPDLAEHVASEAWVTGLPDADAEPEPGPESAPGPQADAAAWPESPACPERSPRDPQPSPLSTTASPLLSAAEESTVEGRGCGPTPLAQVRAGEGGRGVRQPSPAPAVPDACGLTPDAYPEQTGPADALSGRISGSFRNPGPEPEPPTDAEVQAFVAALEGRAQTEGWSQPPS